MSVQSCFGILKHLKISLSVKEKLSIWFEDQYSHCSNLH